MRFTPQPQTESSSAIRNENEVTHVSDSMPGTAVDLPGLQTQLMRAQAALSEEHTARMSERSHYREQEAMWDKQQTLHEDLTREYRLLMGKQKSMEEKLEAMTKSNETLRERLATRVTEGRTTEEQLEQERAVHLLSGNDQIVEITRLRKELAVANEEKQRALKAAQTSEATLEYTKEQYRLAQDAASTSQASVVDLEAQVAKLSHQASGEPAKLKSMHLNRQYAAQEKQIKMLKAENGILKKTLGQKEEELARAKLSGRAGVGTRATSVTPQPKVRSRAASPMGGRLSNLRNG